MNFTLHIGPLINYAQFILKRPATLLTLSTATMEGGFVAGPLYRHDLNFGWNDDGRETLSVVQKFTSTALFGFIEEQLAGTEDVRASGAVAYVMRNLFKFNKLRLYSPDAAPFQRYPA